MTDFDVVESATIQVDATGKRWRALLIKPGWGSKAYYTETALRNDGPTVFKAGTPIFLDHQTPEERDLKPFGSVQNFAGKLATDAIWDAEEGGLVADIEIFEHQQALVRALASDIGLSVRARVRGERGTIEGRSGQIATGLVGARSVDLVVRAGAGGQLLDVLESDIEIETEEQQMSAEVLAAIAKLSEDNAERFAAIDKKFTDIEESLAAAPVVEVEAVEVAEVAETADIEETVKNLVTAELAKREKTVEESAHEEGNEETAEVEESATDIELPSFWAPKGAK